MSKKDIEDTIRSYLSLPNDAKPIGWVGQLAQDIAAAHEEEVARARSEQTELLPCGHPASVVEDDGCAMCNLEAQVAMMIARLIEWQMWLREMEPLRQKLGFQLNRTGRLRYAVDEALSAAPKVVARLRLLDGYGGAEQLGHRRYASDENEWPWIAIDVPWSDPIDLGGADVLVLECPPKGEQGSEQEG